MQNSTTPTERGPKPNLFIAQMAKIDSRMACEQVTRNAADTMNRSVGRSRSNCSGRLRTSPATVRFSAA